jgi:hypothetical protein
MHNFAICLQFYNFQTIACSSLHIFQAFSRVSIKSCTLSTVWCIFSLLCCVFLSHAYLEFTIYMQPPQPQSKCPLLFTIGADRDGGKIDPGNR